MALSCQSCADVSEMVAMAFSVPKLCGHIGDDTYGFVVPLTVRMYRDVPNVYGIERTGLEAVAKIGGNLHCTDREAIAKGKPCAAKRTNGQRNRPNG